MPKLGRAEEQAVRKYAYFLWEAEGRPEGRALIHWEIAVIMRGRALRSDPLRNPDDAFTEDTEAVIDGNPKADFPALLTKDVAGG